MEVEGKGALVAGGASGLGEATARTLAGAGARVVIADLNAEKGEAPAAELGEGASFVRVEFSRCRRPRGRAKLACARAG